MIQIPEYDLNIPESLTVLREYDVVGWSDTYRFREELIKIAGKNPHGRGNLELRWGPTYEDPMQSTPQIKYLDFTHNSQQLGERRFFIEIWRSPEFLIRSGRYQTVNEPDDIQDFYFCKACDAELKDPEKPCLCGSDRKRLKQIRTTNGQQLLKDFPRQGCYDYWLRLERKNLTYHPPDNEALEAIRAMWAWEQSPQSQRDALLEANREIERRQLIQAIRQQRPTRLHFSSVINPA